MAASPRPSVRHAAAVLAAAAACCAACAAEGPALPTTVPAGSTTSTAVAPTLATTTTAPAGIPLRIGVTASVAYAIPFVLTAEEPGIGAANGLAVTAEIYPDPASALAGALAGEVDVAFPDGLSGLAALGGGKCLRAPLTFLERDVMRLVGRSDLIAPEDLIGRKVGTVPGEAGEVALRMWLSQAGVAWGEVTVVPTRPEDMPAALAEGLVDAVIWSEPVPAEALAACGEEACRYVGDIAASYREVVPLSVTCAWADAHGDDGMTRLVRAWLEAKEYTRNNRPEAAAITADRLHLTAAEVAGLWEERAWPDAWPADLTDGQLAMLEADAAYLVEAGALAEAPDLCRWVDSRWLREVAAGSVALEAYAC
jgi:ABC-type nitrate/sulfonate/bicarbonate transport system substrate-binding protein